MELNTPEKWEQFDAGITYEGLRESLSNEMARHLALAREAGLETDTGREHLAAKVALAEVRELLDPGKPELLQAVDLMLRSSQSDQPKATSAA